MTTFTRTLNVGAYSDPDKLLLAETTQGVPKSRTLRVTKLLCLGIHLDTLLKKGQFSSQAVLAGKLGVSKNRLTQILNLLTLAPDIAEEIMFWPPICKGREPLKERMIRPIALELDWTIQRVMWQRLKAKLQV